MTLLTAGGNIGLTLIDPHGNLISPETIMGNPNISYIETDIGMGLLATYQINATLTGTWDYLITTHTSPDKTTYRFIYSPSTQIGVGVTVPGWIPNNTSAVISARVAFSDSSNIDPVIGGNVAAVIQRPDHSSDNIILYDDGAHGDGTANDGVFANSYTQTNLGGVYGVAITATGTFNTESYIRTTATAFSVAPNHATLNGDYNDAGVDDDGDSDYEWLVVTIGIDVAEVSTLNVSAKLFADNTFLDHAHIDQISLNPGAHTVSLHFSGDAIYTSQLDGPYNVQDLLLITESIFRQPPVMEHPTMKLL